MAGGRGDAYPRPARERSGVVVQIVRALEVADGERNVVCERPISNGLTAVAAQTLDQSTDMVDRVEEDKRGARTRYRFGKIQHGKIRHGRPLLSLLLLVMGQKDFVLREKGDVSEKRR